MTICIASIIPLNSPNGVALFNSNFIQLFTRYYHKVIYLYVDINSVLSGEDTTQEGENGLITITLRKRFHVEYKRYKKYFRSGGSDCSLYIAAGLAMREWLFANSNYYKIDIIEVSDGGGIGTFIIDDLLPPVVITGHGSINQISRFDDVAGDEQGSVLKHLENLAYNNAEAIITHSSNNKDELFQRTKKTAFLCKIPWLSISSTNQQSLNSQAIVVGALRHLKGPILICQALEDIKSVLPKLSIKWIGDDAYSVKGYKSTALYLQEKYPDVFQHNLIWEEAVSTTQIIDEIDKAAYIIIPSIWETFSYVALQAASLEKGIIITKTTGASSLFTNNEDALVINANTSELSEAILKFHHNPSLVKKLAANAKRKIDREFISNEIVEERIEVYKNVISGRQSKKICLENNIAFLNRYITYRRKIYFTFRSKIKRLLIKNTNAE